MDSTTCSLVSDVCAISFSTSARGITPTAWPPAANTESATMPIKPTRPPPNTSVTPEFTSSRPSSAATSAYTGRAPELEPQKTQSRWVWRIGWVFSMAELLPRLQIRRRRWAQSRGEALRQKEAAEKQRGVDGVTRECVPEQRHARNVAGQETGAVARVTVQKGPHTEVSDNEKLQSAEESCPTDTRKGIFLYERIGIWFRLSLR